MAEDQSEEIKDLRRGWGYDLGMGMRAVVGEVVGDDVGRGVDNVEGRVKYDVDEEVAFLIKSGLLVVVVTGTSTNESASSSFMILIFLVSASSLPFGQQPKCSL